MQYFAFLLIGLFCQAEAPFFLLSKNLHLCLKRKCTQSLNQQGRSSLKKELKKETLSQHQHEQSTRREQTDQIRESSRAGFLVDLPLTTHVLCIIKRAPGRLSGLRPGLRGVSLSLNWTFPGASCHTLSEPIPQWLLFLISEGGKIPALALWISKSRQIFEIQSLAFSWLFSGSVKSGRSLLPIKCILWFHPFSL